MTREAELELEIASLREALQKSAHMVRENCITPGGNPFALQEIERRAAAKPSPTALQSLIEKVERWAIERCAEEIVEFYDSSASKNIVDFASAIRALPTVLKLEDL